MRLSLLSGHLSSTAFVGDFFYSFDFCLEDSIVSHKLNFLGLYQQSTILILCILDFFEGALSNVLGNALRCQLPIKLHDSFETYYWDDYLNIVLPNSQSLIRSEVTFQFIYNLKI